MMTLVVRGCLEITLPIKIPVRDQIFTILLSILLLAKKFGQLRAEYGHTLAKSTNATLGITVFGGGLLVKIQCLVISGSYPKSVEKCHKRYGFTKTLDTTRMQFEN